MNSTPEKVLETYTGKNGQRYHQLVNQVSEDAFFLVAESRKEKIQPFINKNDIVLEYGVGTGWNLSSLHCKKRLGYDVSEHLEQEISARGIQFVNNCSNLADSSIDVIICHHVLEHLGDPSSALSEINRLLKDGGKLLLFVPWDRGSRFNRFSKDDTNHHLFAWNCQSLGNLVSSCDFEIRVCKTQTFGYDKIASTLAANLKAGKRCFRLIRSMLQLVRLDQEIFVLAFSKKEALKSKNGH